MVVLKEFHEAHRENCFPFLKVEKNQDTLAISQDDSIGHNMSS